MTSPQRPHPFWGLQFALDPSARVLIIDDEPSRASVLDRLTGACDTTWATTPEEVRTILTTQDPFDIYFLDYDFQETQGGWWDTAVFLRSTDPLSVGKIIIVHSSNPDAIRYRELFPVAICIQWDAFATMLGAQRLTHEYIAKILEAAGTASSLDALRHAALQNPLPADSSSQPEEDSST